MSGRCCNYCGRPIRDGAVSINGRHFACHERWCDERDEQLRGDPEFSQEYWGDEA